ncbi:MAG: 5-(carboxyamino)imidazole ribonucleotide mutase [Eubacteriaceae bacterium]|jgi:5-(carboxyamino)imidazole ribonucleotide mutase|nr:5-(carboxyamino)imidazole ribonucleotide mutase [Eubacteriaceae bacterium]
MKKKVALIMGSKSDLPVVQKAKQVLNQFGVDVDMRVISAHRTPYEAIAYAETAKENGIEVLIAAAGKAAHLAGVLAGITPLPVIGIPIKSSFGDGLDSLLSVVQMPKGVPVACMAVDGAENAAYFAIQILALKYPDLMEKYIAYKEEMREDVLKQDGEIQAFS